MKKVFKLIYGDEKNKKYIIFTLIAFYCCLVLCQSISIFHNNNFSNLLSTIKLIRAIILLALIFYYMLDLIFGINKLKLITIILFCLFFINFIFTKSFLLLNILIFIEVLKQYEFEEFVRYIFYWISILFCSVIILSLLNVLPDIEGSRGSTIRHALGFDVPTFTQSVFMFIILTSVYIYKDKISWFVLILETVIATFLYYMTNTRGGYYLSILIIAVAFVVKLTKIVNKKGCINEVNCNSSPHKVLVSIKNMLCNIFKWCIIISPIILCAIFGILVLLWNTQSDFIIRVNQLLSGRIEFTYLAFINHGVSIFGEDILWKTESGSYIGVDNAYYHNIFSFGIVNAVLILAISVLMIYKSVRMRNFWLTFCMIVVVVGSFIGPCLISYQYNVFVFALIELVKSDKRRYFSMDMPINRKMKIVAVVVTYNRKELLKESLQALLKIKQENFDVFVVDNASSDGTFEYIKAELENGNVHYFNTGANIGGAGGFNYGIRKAVESGADYVWVMDDDCIVKENSLSALIDYAKSIGWKFGFLSSKVLWKDGSICVMNKQRLNLWKSIDDFEKNQKIQFASFVSMFINVDVIEKVGLPIKDFFIWGDDWEYSSRISGLFDCYYVSKSEVVHKCQMNVGCNIALDKSDRLNRYVYAYRNEGYMYSKLGMMGKLYFFVKKIVHKFRIYKSPNKKEKLEVMKSGLQEIKTFSPKIEYVYRPETKIKVCEFFGEPLEYGGQEAFMVNMYKNFSCKNIEYTICTPFNLTNKNLIELAKERDERIIHFDYKKDSKLSKLYIIMATKRLLKENKFDVIHIQSGSIFTFLMVAKLAKRSGNVRMVIAHSHCTGKNNIFYKLMKKYSDLHIEKYVDRFFACSQLAGEWKFPRRIIDSNGCMVIKNGIDTSKFRFNPETRKKYRQEFDIKENQLVLCNVGRFAEQKNHNFIVDIASGLREKNVDFKIILVGEGVLKNQIVDKINTLKLIDHFIILEKRNDIAEIMMMSDIFILPSLFEGLPVTLIESQTSGLTTLASNTITKETEITDLYNNLAINDPNIWVDKILEKKNVSIDRVKYADIVKEKGYDAKMSAEILERIYRGEE